ncbi:MAG: LCP family protein [Clostridia bacterium]|nr:LCP family protein [Clostridia bacterium]
MNLKKYFTIVLITVLICAAIFGGMLMARFMISPFEAGEHGDAIYPVENDRVNVLVVGKDSVAVNTDTILIATLHTDTGKVSLMSVPRDTKATINGNSMKINAVYGYAQRNDLNDEELLIETVTKITGIKINYYAVIDLVAFREIVDALDGVEYDVKRDYFYNDPYQDLYIDLKAGHQILNGKDAEGLVRFRADYPRADLERVEVQQDFIKELIKQKLNLKYIAKIPIVYKAVSDNVISNLTVDDVIDFAKAAKSSEDSIHTFTMPNDLSGSYVVPDEDELAALIEEEF